jgi:phospho-N-acetylmuramoyl-pentapeptide-transferase
LSLLVSCLVGFLVSAVSFPLYIHSLKAKEIGQFIREEGPQSHSSKAMTPTMGGVCFMVSFLVAVLAWLACSMQVAHGMEAGMVVVAALLAGLIGLADDTAKLKRQANAGLSARLRLLLEIGLGLALGSALLYSSGGETFAFFGGAQSFVTGPVTGQIPLVLFLGASAFYMTATTNAVNLHDGMDGLAAGTTLLVLLTLATMLFFTGQLQLAVVAAAGAGAVGGFLIYNRYKAAIFMGDTGSLFLGGLMAGLVLAGKLELWFIPLSLIYILEALSVIVQVAYFKLTKKYEPDGPMPALIVIWIKLTQKLPGEGKRFFKMAPLHHHFEAVGAERGLKEWEVVFAFWLAQLAICVAVLLIFLQI